MTFVLNCVWRGIHQNRAEESFATWQITQLWYKIWNVFLSLHGAIRIGFGSNSKHCIAPESLKTHPIDATLPFHMKAIIINEERKERKRRNNSWCTKVELPPNDLPPFLPYALHYFDCTYNTQTKGGSQVAWSSFKDSFEHKCEFTHLSKHLFDSLFKIKIIFSPWLRTSLNAVCAICES